MFVASDFGFDSGIIEDRCSVKNSEQLAIFEKWLVSTFVEQSLFAFQMESSKIKGEQVQ